MQNPGVIKYEIGKLSKAAVDKIPLVVYHSTPPCDSDPKADMHQLPHNYPPKSQKRPMRFHRTKVFDSESKNEASNDDAKDDTEGQSDSWADKWEDTEYPFVTLEGNHAACAICLMDYEAETSDLKLSDAGQGSRPLRLLDCGHIFHVSPLDYIYFGYPQLLISLDRKHV